MYPRPADLEARFVRNASQALPVVWGFLLLLLLALGACSPKPSWHNDDVSGVFPPLAFTMDRASDGRQVTADLYLGKG